VVWDQKANEMAQAVLIGLFPRLLATQETVDKVRSWVEATQPVPAVRRLVSEGIADLERCLRAQARDAES
jgi:aminopeptidase N